jgi:hypothetical protein
METRKSRAKKYRARRKGEGRETPRKRSRANKLKIQNRQNWTGLENHAQVSMLI